MNKTWYGKCLYIGKYILIGLVTLLGFGLFPWLFIAFISGIVEGWSLPFNILGWLVGIAGFVCGLRVASKWFKGAKSGARWLGLSGFGFAVALSPLFLYIIRGSWEAEFPSPRYRLSDDPATLLPISDYAVFASIYGGVIIAVGLIGWVVNLIVRRYKIKTTV